MDVKGLFRIVQAVMGNAQETARGVSAAASEVAGRVTGNTGPDNYPLQPDTRYAAEHELVSGYLEQVRPRGNDWDWEVNARELSVGRALLERDRDAQPPLLIATVERLVWNTRRAGLATRMRRVYGLKSLASALAQRQLAFTPEEMEALLAPVSGCRAGTNLVNYVPLGGLLRQAEHHAAAHGIAPAVEHHLVTLRETLRSADTAEARKLADRIESLVGRTETGTLVSGHPWADGAAADMAAMDPGPRAAWGALLQYCRSADSPEPSRKWLTGARQLIDAIGAEAFRAKAGLWLGTAATEDRDRFNDRNVAVLKGLVWCCAAEHDDAIVHALGALAEVCFQKRPGAGARNTNVGNACLSTLSAARGSVAVGELSALRQRVKYQDALARIGRALSRIAEREGVTADDLEEMAAPDFGLGADGRHRVAVGTCTAELVIEGARQVRLDWYGEDGKPRRAVPAAAKQHPDELKAVKQMAADAERALSAHRDRLDRLMRQERAWPYEAWRERYLEHPLVSHLARRLIWHFRDGERATLAAWHEGRLVDVEMRSVAWPGPGTQVRLWHPIGFAPAEVLCWREWLEANGVTQPFKQAHREVYILTDAELNTGTYSNRFAAHLLRQHQMAALCRQKGWSYHLQGGWDSGGGVPRLEMPEWDLAVEFWVEPVYGGADSYSASGVSLYVSTDQVRFHRLQERQPLPLTEVPALPFSEAMRDVDLFVGVASVGNDPNWHDQGEQPGYAEYWHTYSFGDLSATAATRRDVLSRLVPRLKIAPRCTLTDRFLVVRGELRTYKIHLGSGNILMEPNDQYLCIVPDASAEQKSGAAGVYLPFEGDRTLAVVLSKAFLLADDKKITDPTIVRQIATR